MDDINKNNSTPIISACDPHSNPLEFHSSTSMENLYTVVHTVSKPLDRHTDDEISALFDKTFYINGFPTLPSQLSTSTPDTPNEPNNRYYMSPFQSYLISRGELNLSSTLEYDCIISNCDRVAGLMCKKLKSVIDENNCRITNGLLSEIISVYRFINACKSQACELTMICDMNLSLITLNISNDMHVYLGSGGGSDDDENVTSMEFKIQEKYFYFIRIFLFVLAPVAYCRSHSEKDPFIPLISNLGEIPILYRGFEEIYNELCKPIMTPTSPLKRPRDQIEEEKDADEINE